METKTQAGVVAGGFLSLLTEHDRGAALGEASAALTELAEAVAATGKAGSVTLKLTVKPMGGEVVTVTHEVSAKAPSADPKASVFYWDTETRRLVRDNPHQMRLELRTVEGEAGAERELKTVNQ